MAQRVTILTVDDNQSNMFVQYEDDSNGIVFKMSMNIPDEMVDEDDVLNFAAANWPYHEFEQRGKPPANRHVQAKLLVGVSRNITQQVQNPKINPRHPDFVPPVVP